MIHGLEMTAEQAMYYASGCFCYTLAREDEEEDVESGDFVVANRECIAAAGQAGACVS